jgi:cytoskeletal protein RodZ
LESIVDAADDIWQTITYILPLSVVVIKSLISIELRIFFKFLTEISGNPLQIADTQANTVPESRRLEEESEDSAKENDGDEKIAPSTVPEEVVEADKSGKE